MPDHAPINLDTLRKRTLGHQTLLIDLLKLFREHTPATLERIAAALAAHDLNEGRVAAHKLKSSAATIAAQQLADLLNGVETALTNGKDEAARDLLVLIDNELSRCSDQIDALLATP